MTISIIIIGIIGLFVLCKIPNAYYPACFYFIKFIVGNIIDFDRFRNQVVFQLFIIAVIFLTVTIKNRGVITIRDYYFYTIISFLFIFVIINICFGLLDGHNWFQTIIDSYKYIEIVVFYFLFRICWEDNNELFLGLKSLCYLMTVVGLIELFLTSRGGVGLNLIMSLFPAIILLAMNGYLKFYKIILVVSLLVVVMCQTRTYILGFVVGFIALVLLVPVKHRKKILSSSFLLLIVSIIAVGFLGAQLLSGTLSRFMDLSRGFDESGGYRIDEYIVAIQKFAEHPFIGNGFGYLEYTFINKMGWMNWGDFIHCIYIEILFKTGIAGTVSLIFILGGFVKKIYREMLLFKEKREFMFSICCGGICSLATWMVTYTFAPLSTYGSMFVGVIIAGIACSNYCDNEAIDK